MKNKLAFPLITFIKMNLVYIISYIVFVIVLAYFVPSGIKQNLDTKKKIEKLNTEIELLVKKEQTIKDYVRYDIDTLYSNIRFQLPDSEDYFSVFNAVDRFGRQSNTVFEDNTSPFEEKKDNSVVISLSSSGDIESLKQLLSLHHFKSGRFMSIEDVEWSPENNSIILKVAYYVYAKKDKVKSIPAIDNKFVESVISELSKVPSEPVVEDELLKGAEYDTTANPFLKL